MSARVFEANLFALAAVAMILVPAAARAAEADSTAAPMEVVTPADTSVAAPDSAATPGAEPAASGHLTALVPAIAESGYRISDDRRRFKNRISFSPGIGKLGENTMFAFRAGFSPNTWLGYEISLGHNPANGLHALLHSFNVVLRYPLRGRFQPYMTLGYGMMTVYPGHAINADPVTKNTLMAGGGLEIYLRDDVAIRGELRGASVLGQELGSEGTVSYDYREYTIGFSFYRNLGG